MNRSARYLCRQGWLRPSWLGYRDLSRVRPEQYCRGRRGSFRILQPARVHPCRLPVNIPQRGQLSRNPGRYERSFYDVPDYHLERRTHTVIRDARILRYRDQWGDDFYAILSPDDRFLEVTGTSLQPEHLELLKRKATQSVTLDEATWIITHSTRNHFMWLYSHLPRLMLAESLGLHTHALLPARDLLSDVKLQMLGMLGFAADGFISPQWQIIRVAELHIPDLDGFDPWVLESMRARFSSQVASTEKVMLYITRRHCHYRKMRDEEETLNRIAQQKEFKTVALEHLTLKEQIDVLANAKTVFGVHGAGFANLIFCKDTKVIEIQDAADPNPHFYALASLLNLDYALLLGQVREEEEAHFRDIGISADEVIHALR